MLVDKARQISECIDALTQTDRPATLPGVDMTEIHRIWPVVVLEGALAHTPLLRDHLQERLAGALTQPRTRPLTTMAMSDLERLAGYIEHGHRFAMTLRRWQGRCPDADFAYFCTTKPELRAPRHARSVVDRWERLTGEVNAAFSIAARAGEGSVAEGAAPPRLERSN